MTKHAVTETGIIASVSAIVAEQFSFDPRLSAGIAAAVILVILKAGRTALCSMTVDELVSRLDSKGNVASDANEVANSCSPSSSEESGEY